MPSKSEVKSCSRFRFADVFGLEIADIKTFLDEVPNIPKSAFQDLKDAELSDMESDAGSGMDSMVDFHDIF